MVGARRALFTLGARLFGAIHRWLPDSNIVLAADSAFAAVEFPAEVRRCQLVPLPGKPLKKLSVVMKDRKISWQACRISLWYGRTNRLVEIASGTAICYHGGAPPVPIRWLLVRDPTVELEAQAFLATDLHARPGDILTWFVSRWQVEVTFGGEVRAHLAPTLRQ
jgi:hypothetical protein